MAERELVMAWEPLKIIVLDEMVNNFPGMLFCSDSCPCLSRISYDLDSDPMHGNWVNIYCCGLTRKVKQLDKIVGEYNKYGYANYFNIRQMACLKVDPDFTSLAQMAEELMKLKVR